MLFENRSRAEFFGSAGPGLRPGGAPSSRTSRSCSATPAAAARTPRLQALCDAVGAEIDAIGSFEYPYETVLVTAQVRPASQG
ncbi:MAG TPA: hypothetical protein VFI54_01475 [Solirubrobacteraceae bacterium]|nr:hypothetical protein [Solirubrobacteraceae bacterium]